LFEEEVNHLRFASPTCQMERCPVVVVVVVTTRRRIRAEKEKEEED